MNGQQRADGFGLGKDPFSGLLDSLHHGIELRDGLLCILEFLEVVGPFWIHKPSVWVFNREVVLLRYYTFPSVKTSRRGSQDWRVVPKWKSLGLSSAPIPPWVYHKARRGQAPDWIDMEGPHNEAVPLPLVGDAAFGGAGCLRARI